MIHVARTVAARSHVALFSLEYKIVNLKRKSNVQTDDPGLSRTGGLFPRKFKVTQELLDRYPELWTRR